MVSARFRHFRHVFKFLNKNLTNKPAALFGTSISSAENTIHMQNLIVWKIAGELQKPFFLCI